MLIGFNTGVLHKIIQPVSREMIKICKEVGSNAIEIGCGNVDRIVLLKDIKKKDLTSFEYISLHAPAGHRYKDDKQTKEILKKIEEEYNRLNVRNLIIHPNSIDNWKVFDNYNMSLLVENMGKNELFSNDVQLFKPIFENKDYKMVLDLNHCIANDKTMKLADDFISNFGNRICELHISGYIDKNNLHQPLFKTKQNKVLDSIHNINLPLIIESECESVEEIKKEINYIKNYLENDYTSNR